ncbi:HepT-like ribonuclease domain-containing protein [Larkinella humicola]|uniref:DUF86 domain-containing protein n=1 Tax=Larkinella humicola TaxID=2607654 RepID=A0A5N1JBU8_9BACT|nr:DUF86 domain-containing protein [Larkinella humicola]KAA9352754.1 DUF86 domain-containing protein [Larkinella humicola]
MNRDDTVYLQDIIESINIIFDYMRQVTELDFNQSTLIQDAVYRRFEIIGEATIRLSDQLKAKYPEVEWKLMRAMRNKLAHEYFGISASTVYNTVKAYLPALLEKLTEIQNEQRNHA